MISASAVRMAIKNRLIIAALRDAQAYDPAVLEALAREQFLTFADETDATARRLEADDASVDDREAYRRGPEVFRSLAEALRREAGERDHVAALVARARDDAWQEVGRAILTRLTSSENRPGADPDYERNRSRRISKLVRVDLASLARERAVR